MSETAALTVQEPPQNLAMEQAVLSAIMSYENTFEEVSEVLCADDFYSDRHKIIFDSISHLASINSPYDNISVTEQLERQKKLEAAGGVDYFLQIDRSGGTRYNLQAYAGKIQELSTYRKLIKTANTILQMAHHPDKKSVSDILDIAESQIFAINEARHQTGNNQGLKKGDDVLLDVLKMTEHRATLGSEYIIGVDTGFTGLNNKIQGLQQGDLLILAARPSMGKTALALNIAQGVLVQEKPVLFFSMEMSADAIVMRLLSAWSGVDHTKVRTGDLNDSDWDNLASGGQMISNTRLYIDDRNNLSPNELRSTCRKVVKEAGALGLVVVDYLQLMQVPGMGSGNRVGEISEISRSLKGLARELNCPVLALSQLNRSLEQRTNKRPIMADLRESGAIEQDADVIMFIYRDEVYNKERSDNKGKAELIVSKNRNGAIGTVDLRFSGHLTRFDDALPQHLDDGDY